MTAIADRCGVCPYHINDAKILAIAYRAIGNLAAKGDSEAIEAQEQMIILANLKEPALCAPCEVSP